MIIYSFNDDAASEKKILPHYDDAITDEVKFWLSDSFLLNMNRFFYL